MIRDKENPKIEAIAIIGMAGRFPKSPDLDAFWQHLRNGDELVDFFTEEELLAEGLDPELIHLPNYVPARAILEGAEEFDAGFFGYTPREAEVIDPQQRVFLESAWEALENAGYDPSRYPGKVGVFAGLSMNSYLYWNLAANPQIMESMGGYQIMLSNDKDFLTTRVSYKLGLSGPSVNVQTACSTSLVAVVMGCQSLLGYHCDMALAGGVSISSPRKAGYLYQPGMILSPDGHCRAFDASAQGIVAGEGVGIVVLKRLSDALADGDSIRAVIMGSAINNDGSLKVGYTAPSVSGQAEAIAAAQAAAGIEPDTIGYIEAHGTGTELGDPIEISALTQAFRLSTQRTGFSAIGSVKTNMGHLDAAAGVAGLIKTVLALQHRQIPPSLHYERPNPRIDFDSTPFYVNARLSDWPGGSSPRRAGASSFGIGGTNAHVVLEEAPEVTGAAPSRTLQLMLLSARTESALQSAVRRQADALHALPPGSFADAAYTLAVGRKEFDYRKAVVASTAEQAAQALDSGDMLSGSPPSGGRRTVFMFTGQGSQYTGMGSGLYASERVFREELDRCAELLKPHLGFDLLTVLYPPAGASAEAEAILRDTKVAQPALFAVEWALARLWISWGVQPAAMIGHSIGEYVAACLAGVFSLEDALSVVAARGRLMSGMPTGAMLTVALPEEEVRAMLLPDLSLAAVNAPSMCVVSGAEPAVAAFESRLVAAGVSVRRLHTSHAFHSPMMDPILEPFRQVVAGVPRFPPQLPFVSNLTGDWITPEQAVSADYWATHLRSTVRFAQGLALLAQDSSQVLLEVGPGGVLVSLARNRQAHSAILPAYPSLRHPQESVDDLAFLLNSLARLWLAGVTVSWEDFYAQERRRRIPLPTYPFERKRYWVKPNPSESSPVTSGRSSAADTADHLNPPLKNPDISNWFYRPTWQRAAPLDPPSKTSPENWLIFQDNTGSGGDLALQLERMGQRVFTVEAGGNFEALAGGAFRLSPGRREDYDALLSNLSDGGNLPDHIVHFWCLPAAGEGVSEFQRLEETSEMGFYSLLFLAQALGEMRLPRKLKIQVVSSGLADVTGEEPLEPARALLFGPARVIPQEFPGTSCQIIDLVLPEHGRLSDSQLEMLKAEVLAEIRDGLVAHRGGRRWVEYIERAPLKKAPAVPARLRQNGIYLVTGGLGGVGYALAEYLARSVQARLVLVGRASLPPRSEWQKQLEEGSEDDPVRDRIHKIQALEELGAEVLYCQADVRQLEQLAEAVKSALSRWGSLNGAIHAAGLPGEGLIALKTRQAAERVIAPKTVGLLNLIQAMEGEPLDFLAFCSSFNAIIGGVGNVDYCAANAYLDAFASAANRHRSPMVYSINWGTWADVGMAAASKVPPSLQALKEATLKQAILPGEGQEAFARLLTHSVPQMVVASQDFYAIRRMISAVQEDGSNQPVEHPAVPDEAPAVISAPDTAQHYDRPDLTSPFVPPATDTQAKIAAIWSSLLGVEPVGVRDNFFELGGHSLLAAQLITRIQRIFPVELPLRTIFESPTIEAFSEQVDLILWAKHNKQSALTDAGEDREELEF